MPSTPSPERGCYFGDTVKELSALILLILMTLSFGNWIYYLQSNRNMVCWCNTMVYRWSIIMISWDTTTNCALVKSWTSIIHPVDHDTANGIKIHCYYDKSNQVFSSDKCTWMSYHHMKLKKYYELLNSSGTIKSHAQDLHEFCTIVERISVITSLSTAYNSHHTSNLKTPCPLDNYIVTSRNVFAKHG